MSNMLRNLALASLVAASAGAFMSTGASALSMAECSAKYKSAKAAGTDGGMKWNDFRKAQCGTDASAAAPAPAAPATPAKATKAVTAPAAPAVTDAKMSMQDCSAAWKKLKDANTVPAGMNWNSFRSAGCKVDGAAPATQAKMTPPAANTTAAAPATTPSGSFMQNCSAAWKSMKAANSVPAGMTWKDFVAAKCTVAGAAPAPAQPSTASIMKKKTSIVPPEPTDTVDNSPIPTVDKNGKALSAGRIAAIKRIRQCGAMYQKAKASNTLPADIAGLDGKHRWPQYWSQCNTQLKAQGL